MKKVMLAISTLTGGGAERVASVWANQLIKKGYEVGFLLYCRSQNEYPVSSKAKINTLAETYDDYKEMGYFKRVKLMKRAIKAFAPDVVISFLPRMQIWMMFATRFMKIKKIETVRISPWHIWNDGVVQRLEKALWKRCFKKADKVIFQTAEQREFFSSKIEKKGVVIPNPMSEQYRDNPKEAYSDSVKRFVAAGRITSQKNYPAMIEAFSKVSANHPEVTLSIYGAGDDAYLRKIQGIIDKFNLSDKVKLMGRTTDILSVLKSADAFLMTSDFEGMPNALAEAMVMGLPCLSTNCRTGPKDMISDGENGYLVEVSDIDSIADGIEKLASMDSARAEKMGKAARTTILEMCSEEMSLKKLIDVIEN